MNLLCDFYYHGLADIYNKFYDFFDYQTPVIPTLAYINLSIQFSGLAAGKALYGVCISLYE